MTYISKEHSDYDLVYLLTTLTDIYLEIGNADLATKYMKRVEKVLEDEDYILIQAYLARQKGFLSFINGDLMNCIKYLDESIRLYKSIDGTEALPEIYKKKAEAYFELNRFEEAYQAFSEADEYLTLLNYSEVAGLLSRYEQEKRNRKELERTQLAFDLEKQKIKNQNLHLRIAVLSLFLLSILIFVVIFFLIRSRKMNNILISQNEKIRENQFELEQNIKKIQQNELKLTELNNTKDRFFSIIAHDLRNPLSSVIGLSNLCLVDNKTFTQEEIMQIMESLNSSAKYGFNLLENLMEWALSNTGRMTPVLTRIEYEPLLQKQLAGLNEIAANKHIKIKVKKPAANHLLFADENMLSTILRNLIHNAIKFSNEKGIVTVSFSPDTDNMIISIEDQGIGISPDVIGQIFTDNSMSSRFGTGGEKGSGLGLLLCKEFVEKIGGKIWVESVVGEGSKFSFSVPLATN